MLLGADGWATHKEYGVLFSLDATRCMFSSGNVTERGRMGGLDAAGETVVDLFTGIGYYTLPLLARAGAAKVPPIPSHPSSIQPPGVVLRVHCPCPLDVPGHPLLCRLYPQYALAENRGVPRQRSGNAHVGTSALAPLLRHPAR